MKDRIFEGRDLPRALDAASGALGVPVSRLRYVVLEEGRPESASASAQPARIAVLLDALSVSGARPPEARPEPPAQARGDVRVRLARLVAAIGEASGEPLEVAFEESDQMLVARLSGAGEALLLDQGGKGLRALEHIMQRALADEPRRLLLTSERYRAERDLYLRERALQLASAVRGDGTARETEPLNAYDRRIVHLAVQDEPGVRSFSVGEGSARRVTVAPAATDAGGPAPDAV